LFNQKKKKKKKKTKKKKPKKKKKKKKKKIFSWTFKLVPQVGSVETSKDPSAKKK